STGSANGEMGIWLLGDGPATVRSSSAFGNGDTGILVEAGDSARVQSSTASANGQQGIVINGNGTVVLGNRAEGNSFASGASDLGGWGIQLNWSDTAPRGGKNIARGNDDPAECNVMALC